MLSFVLLFHVAVADVPKTIPLPHIRGKELYDDLCFQCHGVNGMAETPLAKSTGSPKLAGKFLDGNYAEGIKVVQQGVGTMPAYEMIIDKHDTKRILIYLSGLDAQTGLDPRVKPEEEEEPEQEPKKSNTNLNTNKKKPVKLNPPKKPVPENKP